MEVQRAYAQALLVDRKALEGFQNDNDALMATDTLKAAYRTDVEPILAMARLDQGAAISPVAAYRASDYRNTVAQERPAVSGAGHNSVWMKCLDGLTRSNVTTLQRILHVKAYP